MRPRFPVAVPEEPADSAGKHEDEEGVGGRIRTAPACTWA